MIISLDLGLGSLNSCTALYKDSKVFRQGFIGVYTNILQRPSGVILQGGIIALVVLRDARALIRGEECHISLLSPRTWWSER